MDADILDPTEPKLITMDGTMEMCNELDINPESVGSLILYIELKLMPSRIQCCSASLPISDRKLLESGRKFPS